MLHRIEVFGALGHNLKTTNCLESMNAKREQLMDEVDHWRRQEQKYR